MRVASVAIMKMGFIKRLC